MGKSQQSDTTVKPAWDAAEPMSISLGAETVHIDLDDPDLSPDIKQAAFESGGYPYPEKLKRGRYEDKLERLQIELGKLHNHLRTTGGRLLVVFEGRDAAGKGGTIARFSEYLNPRYSRTVALAKPSEREQSQWYFQRYVPHLPAGGEIVLFDRSWYNRAVVEKVMGFADAEQVAAFLANVPTFERLLVEDGIILVKFWLNIGREMQLKRFHDRRHDPLRHWKLSPVDVASLGMWDDYTAARDEMFAASHTSHAPWTVIRANDKRRLRLEALRAVLQRFDYPGKDAKAVEAVDPKIAMPADEFMSHAGPGGF